MTAAEGHLSGRRYQSKDVGSSDDVKKFDVPVLKGIEEIEHDSEVNNDDCDELCIDNKVIFPGKADVPIMQPDKAHMAVHSDRAVLVLQTVIIMWLWSCAAGQLG